MIRFKNDDSEYEKWLRGHSSGFVFNHFGGTEQSKEMNIIHRADRRYLHRNADQGRRTTIEKICSTSLEELQTEILRIRGASWVKCKSCF